MKDKKQRLLDLGCGDGYFLYRWTKCKERYGLDKLLGDEIEGSLDFPDNYFDYVTMLAVIEHLSQPEKLIREIWRVLKPNGKLIITTPKMIAEFFIKFYYPNIKKEHKYYFDLFRIKRIFGNGFKLCGYHTFALGLNQAFCLQKIENK